MLHSITLVDLDFRDLYEGLFISNDRTQAADMKNYALLIVMLVALAGCSTTLQGHD
ncbi:hypothetical protein [Chlorobium limicola]|uniref:hypothetical protein n=1 Tax=Chlorobium limicola TaxID=1092 RepID=UPI0023F20B1D|nr:hypothetical protein [Chlorobium limicola]